MFADIVSHYSVLYMCITFKIPNSLLFYTHDTAVQAVEIFLVHIILLIEVMCIIACLYEVISGTLVPVF